MKISLLSLLLVLLSFAPARACSCIGERISEQVKINQAYQRDSLILVGKVVSVETIVLSLDTLHMPSWQSGADTVYTSRREGFRYTFAVTRVLKGAATGSTIYVTTANQSSACGVSLKVGADYLLHAYKVDQHQTPRGEIKRIAPYFATSICHRTRELKYVPRTELRQLARLARKA